MFFHSYFDGHLFLLLTTCVEIAISMNRKNEEIFPEFEYIDQNYGKIRQSSVFSCNNNLAYNDFMQHFIMSSIKLLNCNFSKQKRE